jgi:hypothetical protein
LEDIVAKRTTKQVLWHRSILEELKFDILKTSTIFSEHQAAVSSPRIPHESETHRLLLSLFSRFQNGRLDIGHVSTQNNPQDIFAKGLPAEDCASRP